MSDEYEINPAWRDAPFRGPMFKLPHHFWPQAPQVVIMSQLVAGAWEHIVAVKFYFPQETYVVDLHGDDLAI